MEVYGAHGYNGYGQFGDGTANSQYLPKQMQDTDGSILYGVKEVAAGRYYTAVIKEDNTVWGAGENGYRQLGIGEEGTKHKIVQMQTLQEVEEAGEKKQVAVPVTDAKHITCGAQSTYVSKQKDEDGNNTGFYVVRKK